MNPFQLLINSFGMGDHDVVFLVMVCFRLSPKVFGRMASGLHKVVQLRGEGNHFVGYRLSMGSYRLYIRTESLCLAL